MHSLQVSNLMHWVLFLRPMSLNLWLFHTFLSLFSLTNLLFLGTTAAFIIFFDDLTLRRNTPTVSSVLAWPATWHALFFLRQQTNVNAQTTSDLTGHLRTSILCWQPRLSWFASSEVTLCSGFALDEKHTGNLDEQLQVILLWMSTSAGVANL